jgi:hypothetical protein
MRIPPNEDAESESSRNPVVNAILTIIGLLLWLVITLSLADLILQLLVMPFVLLARAFGVMRWPVQVERDHQFVRTEFADGFDAAAVLHDDLSTQIQGGELIADPVKP